MKNKLSKTEAKKEIEEFFKDIKDKAPKEIKKIKKFSASYKIPLKKKRKTFCKKCFSAYKFPKIRIKSGKKTIECENCSYKSRYKIIS
jgi:RNase P subunit RPR2